MPKLTEELTDRVMRNLPVPETGSVLHYDPVLKGFTGRVTSKAARAFVGVYHFGGIERRDTIGSFPAWGAKAARQVFLRWRREIDLGIDPRGEPEPEKSEAATFGTLAKQFVAHGRTKRGRVLRAATVKEYRRALLTYAAELHDRNVTDISRAAAAELIRTVATQRGTTSAMRTRAAGSRFYSWLIANGAVESNPFTGTEGYATTKRSRVLHDAELAALWAATAELADFNLIVRICLWTGCRRSEAGGMTHSELKDGVWTVPSTRTKNHRPLALPMPQQALAALAAWPRRLGRDHLFGSGGNGFQSWSKAKARLDAKLRFDEPFDLHDIRRSVQSRMIGLGIAPHIVNRCLNHVLDSVSEAYDRHSYAVEKGRALAAWADEIDRIVSAPSNVVRLAERQ